MTDPEFLKENNIKILQISATPSNALIDAEEWLTHHSCLCPKIRSGYVSFHCLLEEDRVIDPFNLEDQGDSAEYLELKEEPTKEKRRPIRVALTQARNAVFNATTALVSNFVCMQRS